MVVRHIPGLGTNDCMRVLAGYKFEPRSRILVGVRPVSVLLGDEVLFVEFADQLVVLLGLGVHLCF